MGMLGPSQRYAKPAKRQAITVLVRVTLTNGYVAAARAVIVLLPKDVQPYRVLMFTPLAARSAGSNAREADACGCLPS